MANDWFRFKRFTVMQSGAAMKVGTDGTLLGAWAELDPEQQRILDIGTGTGLIALMLAQRSEGWKPEIHAIDIDAGAAEQATDNFRQSPWPDRLAAFHTGLREFASSIQDMTEPEGYDHIVSNPPFFNDSLVSPDAERTAARHTSLLSHEELIRHSSSLLRPGGHFSVILPFETGNRFVTTAGIYGLALTRRTAVRSLPEVQPKRVLLEFRKPYQNNATPATTEDELLIEHSPGGNYTDEYRALTADFYLKF